jgi:hypothetical protein
VDLGLGAVQKPTDDPKSLPLTDKQAAAPAMSSQHEHGASGHTPSPKAQKAAFLGLLRRVSTRVQTQAKFPWLKVPVADQAGGALGEIYRALRDLRGFDEFARAGFQLACDFFLSEARVIIEYDERQHFTAARAVSLSLYPPKAALGFDRQAWRTECLGIDAHDATPPYRDEQRAFYDAGRDLLAAKNGMRLIRLRRAQHDWTAAEAWRDLATLLSLKTPNPSSADDSVSRSRAVDSIARVALVSHDYRVPNSFGQTDFSEHFQRINELCDHTGCDTVLYALYTRSPRSPLPRSPEMFDDLSSVRRIVLEVAERGQPVDQSGAAVELWGRDCSGPRVVRQCFARSADRNDSKQAFIAQLPARRIANGVLVLCGETNIATVRRRDGCADLYGFVSSLDKLGASVVLNPIHDYMRRPEMAWKRGFYSREGRTVMSVWNKGKGAGEARIPWTVFHNGVNRTGDVRELSCPLAERPDVRIGVVDLFELV